MSSCRGEHHAKVSFSPPQKSNDAHDNRERRAAQASKSVSISRLLLLFLSAADRNKVITIIWSYALQ